MKNSQRGFIIPLLLVIAALLLTGGAYVYMQKQSANKSTENPVDQATSTTQSSNSQTADWKTYQNEKYGFEVKYPYIVGYNIYISNNNDEISFPFGGALSFHVYINNQTDFSKYNSGALNDKSIYDELIKLNQNFEGYQPKKLLFCNLTAGYECKDEILKIKIDGIPALDIRFLSGGDTGR